MASYQKRGYLLENFRLFHLRSTQDTIVEYHYHEFYKLLLLVSGSGGYVVDGQRYLLQPGDVVLIGSRSVHRPELNRDSPYERIIIYISPDFLQRESTAGCDLAEIFSPRQGHVLRLKEPQRRKLFSMAAALEKDLGGEEYGRDILSNGTLLQLLVEIGRNLRRPDHLHPSPEMPENDRILELLRYIDAHLTEDLDIEQLAEEFYISKFYMMRLFRRETGTTIHSYLTRRRLYLARELIDGGMRTTEACYRCGFRSYSSFTRAYGKYFGTTPAGRMDAAREREEGFE